MQLLARASPTQLKWRDVNVKTVTALKTGLVLRTLFHSGSMERRSESFLRYTHQLTACPPMDISLWRARQGEEYERHFAWLVLGKKGQIYKPETCTGCLQRKQDHFICCTLILESCILSGCFGKSAPLGNHFLLSVSGCPPTTLRKGVQRVITAFCTVSAYWKIRA